MRFSRVCTTLGLLTTVAAGGWSTAMAATLYYEGFDYPVSANLSGQSGGIGWSGSWSGFDLPARIVSGLSFGNLATSPGAATTIGNNRDVALYFRSLQTAIGADNTELYLSFLLRPEAGFGFYGGLNLIGNFFTGKSGNPVATYGLESVENNTSSITSSSLTAQAGQTVFLVLHAQFRNGDDIFDLYVNPTPGQPQPLTANARKDDFDLGQTNLLYFNNAGNWTTDEIRIGETFADVTPVATTVMPLPTTLLLTVAGFAGIAVSRRRIPAAETL